MLNFEGTTHMKLNHTCANCFEDIQIIEEGPIEGKQNQLIRRTTSYCSGLYTIKLIINGNTDKTLKINIIK